MIARNLFDSYDSEKNGILSEKDLSNMLKSTYKIINKGYIIY